MIPEGLLYSADHEWIRVGGSTGRVGITHYAQEALGSVVFVDLPGAGLRVAAGEAMGVLESVKAASDCISPVSGKVAAVNDDLLESPGLINEDPYGRGWIADMDLEDPGELGGLMDHHAYGKFLESENK